MGQIKWYKRDPEAALRGMQRLSLELRGAYNTVLDLIYVRDGNLPDDDRFIAGYLGVDVRVWKRLKTQLLHAGKLYVDAGRLHNETADVVVATALARVVSARNAGKLSAQSKASKNVGERSENSNLGSTTVETGASTGVPTIESKSKISVEEESSTDTQPRETRGSRGSRIKPDWAPSPLPETVAALVAQWPAQRVQRELENFRDYWTTRSRDAARTDWDKTWHNRIRDIHDRVLRDNRNGSGNTPRDNRDGFTRVLDRELGLDGDGLPARASG